MGGRTYDVEPRGRGFETARRGGAPVVARDRALDGTHRLLDLQRLAGNAAVLQLIDGEGATAAGEPTAVRLTAIEQLETAAARDLFDKGAEAFGAGDYAHAYDFFAQAYRVSPRPMLLFDQAQALRRMGGRREEAIDLYVEYLESDDKRQRKVATAALAELRAPQTIGDEQFDTAAAKSVFDRGAAAYAAGDFANAYDCFVQAYELSPRPNLLFSQAQALRRLGGRRQEAIALYERYVGTPGGNHVEVANEALEQLRTSERTGIEEIDTAAARAAFDDGAAAMAAGDYGRAYDDFVEAHQISPRPLLLFDQAQALRLVGGRRDEAVSLYRRYLATGDRRCSGEAQAHLQVLESQGAERP